MASTFNLSNFTANTEATSINTASTLGGATLTIYDGTQPTTADTALSGNTALATFTLPANTSNTVSTAGVVTVGAITAATASNTGTATFFRVTNSTNTLFDGSIGTTNADMILNSTSITSGATVSISSFSLTVTH